MPRRAVHERVLFRFRRHAGHAELKKTTGVGDSIWI